MLSNSLEAIISQQLIARADGKGRVAAFEILVANSAVRNLIRENKNAQLTSVIQTGAAVGMCTMKDSIKKLESEKLISNNNSNSASSQSTDVPINDGDF
jgi:twitching motility protein PilT